MTAAERVLLRGFTRLQEQQSRGSIVLSSGAGSLGTFTCVANQNNNLTQLALGGTENERSITFVCERAQFVTANVTPAAGMSVTYQGSRYVVENIPSSHDEVLVTLECVEPTRG